MNELTLLNIMSTMYTAMDDYNFVVRIKSANTETKRAYINGLITMAMNFGIQIIIKFENAHINSKIIDILINGHSLTDWINKQN